MFPAIPLRHLAALFGLATTAFIFNTSEFMPIGLLMDIAQSFSMTEADTGIMIAVYAWVVALLSLPLMLLTCNMELKKLMLITIGVFGLGQLGSGLATSFSLLMAARICVACAHSIFWSIVAHLATRLVTKVHQPFALAVVATGSAIAMIMGLPLGRVVGLYAGWRTTFLLIALISLFILIYLFLMLPKRQQNTPFTLGDLPALLTKPSLAIIYIMTAFFALAYYTTYSYIEPYLSLVAGFQPEEITLTLVILGCCGIGGSVIFSRLYGHYRRTIIRMSLISVSIALFLWLPAAQNFYTMLLIGMILGTISTLYNITFQAELLNQASAGGATVAMSIFSGIYNLGIGSGSWLGGLLTGQGNLAYIGLAGGIIATLSLCIGLFYYLPLIKAK
ncbi:MAG: MFS transporter [Selenomonas sp.]|uniref:MFS transporter n=1 Tax=Selenomonas sp. TaxID=2053611 RepID=UPI0025D2ED85|nr:MFS transporter [Selenomonas sp.]MCR5756546.1 MFS transporter [Selenomonas sp.]